MTTSNTSLVWECIPASKPGANLVNPAYGPSLWPHDRTGREREVDFRIEADVDHAEPVLARPRRVILGLERRKTRRGGHTRQLALAEDESEAADHLAAPQGFIDHNLAFGTARHGGDLKLARGQPGEQGGTALLGLPLR